MHPRDLPSLFASIFSCLSLSPTLDVALSLFGAPHPASTFYTWFTVGGGGGVALRKSAAHVRVHVHVEALKVAVANAIKTNAKNMRKAQKKKTQQKSNNCACCCLKFMCWWAANLSWQLRMPAETLSKPWWNAPAIPAWEPQYYWSPAYLS